MNHCNLLPFEFQRRLLTRSRLQQWSAVWCLTAVLAVAGAAHRMRTLLAHETRLQQMEQRCEPLREMLAENRRLRNQLAEMNSRELLAGELAGARYPLELLGLISHTAHACGADVQIREFSLSHVTRPRPVQKTKSAKSASSAPPAAEPEMISLTLTGMAIDGLAVARFVTSLRETNVFESVELKSSLAGRVGAMPAREYELTCTF